MRWSSWTPLVAWSLIVSALSWPTSAVAQLKLGNVVVIDAEKSNFTGDFGFTGFGSLFSVDPASSARIILSDFGDPSKGELGVDPIGVAIDASGNILVLDQSAAGSHKSIHTPFGALFSINPTTGERTVISDFDDPAQGPEGRLPTGMTVDVSNILVIDEDAGPSGSGVIFSVDPETGFRTIVSDFGDSKGPQSRGGLISLAVDAAGDILALDNSNRVRLLGALFTVNPSSGVRTILSDFNDTTKGAALSDARGLAIDASGNIWVTAVNRGMDDRGVLFSVDPASGFRTMVSDFGNPAQGERGIDPLGVAIGTSGNILVTDLAGGRDTNDRGVLFSVDPASGFRTVVSDFGNPAQGERGIELFGVAVAPTLPTQPVDLTIADIEITQAIQNFANDVPLVQDKTTYVRVYPAVDIADRRVGARLRGFRGGVELPGSPLRPLYPLATVHTTGASRATLNDSFNFWIPPEWRSGNVAFRAEINFGGLVPETDTSNNILSLEKEFTPIRPVCVRMIPVRTHGSRYTVESPGFDSIIARFESLWPVPRAIVTYQSSPVEELQARFGIPPVEFGPYELPEDTKKVLNALRLRSFFSNVACTGTPFRTVGMVSPDTNTGDLGAAYPGSSLEAVFAAGVSWVLMEENPSGSHNLPPGGVTMAQEITHNFGGVRPWGHVDCGMPPGINPDYPYPPDQIGPDGPDTFWGFDPITRAIIQPKIGKDFMSYCGPEWVSDYTWTNIFDAINPRRAPFRSLEIEKTLAALNQSTEILVVGGVITPTANVASFDYGYRLPQGMIGAGTLEEFQPNVDAPTGAATRYTLELVDVSESVLFSLPFEPQAASTGDSAEQGFFLTVPFDPKTARVRITQNGRELGALSVSANAPQVSVLQPVGGETVTDRLTIRWEGSDQDNDLLLYTVQYSPDFGASWQALVIHTPETTLTLDDTFSLPGSDQALIRVIANDGVNTGSDTSDPFTVQGHGPVVHIDTPSDQALFALNSQIILMGRARDAEDGPLENEALQWIVNGAVVGSGPEAAVGGLAPGDYDITLEAVDSDNNIAITSVTITVVGDMPVASADSYSTPKNTPLTVDAPGVLGNDIDPEGDPLSAVLVSNVSHGTLTLNADGAFTYTPAANFIGTDSFTYTANNGSADSNIVIVSLVVGEEGIERIKDQGP
jgi:Bacterial Ig domain